MGKTPPPLKLRRTRDPRVDAYIEESEDFAKPILTHLRTVVHAACLECTETMKWSVPHFDYKGMLCSMAAFKTHCVFGFWKGQLLFEGRSAGDAVRSFDRITSVRDLPSEKTLGGYIRKAMALNDEGVKAPHMLNRKARPALPVPDDFLKAVKKSKKAFATFESFPPSHRREYVEWITEAKTDGTRKKRTDQAVEWMAEGRSRNWKYER